MRRINFLLTLTAAWMLCSSTLQAYNSIYEIEPNDKPLDFNEVNGSAILIGEMDRGDQDGYRWTISDVDAQQSWTISFQGVPGRLSVVDVIRLTYAENGVDVISQDKLVTLSSRDGSKPVGVRDLIFEPGQYILGLAQGGSSGGLYSPPTGKLDLGETESESLDAVEEEPRGYRLSLGEGRKLTVRNPGKNPDAKETALSLRLNSYYSAFHVSKSSWYRFKFQEKHTQNRWEIRGAVPVGREAQVVLRDSDGGELAKTVTDGFGRYVFPDLGLDAGIYYLDLKADAENNVRSVILRPTGERVSGSEAEPNDSWLLANHVDPLVAVSGRMGTAGEADFFHFETSEENNQKLFTLQLETTSTSNLTLCLTNSDGKDIQCRKSKGSSSLPDLVLPAGQWGFVVKRGAEAVEYTVDLVEQGVVQAGFEIEPNDSVEYASTIPEKLRIKGRFSAKEDDFYRLVITGSPQLWRFQVMGDGIHELAYHDASGGKAQVFRTTSGQRRVRLDNLYLLPGVHHIRVSGKAEGSYTLMTKPIGQPNPDAEMEPNDSATRMSPLAMGQTRTGLLQDKADTDYYRFHLTNYEHVELKIAPPIDGSFTAKLRWDGAGFKENHQDKPGQPAVIKGLLPPGDYQLSLRARQPSEAEYHLSLKRLPRYACAADCEPNDTRAFANPLPVSMSVDGNVNEWRDTDWFILPAQQTERPVTIHVKPQRGLDVVEEYGGTSYVKWDRELGAYHGILPAGIQTYIVIAAWGEPPYQMSVQFDDEPQATTPLLPVAEASVDLSLNLETMVVAAYLESGQRVQGELQLRNSSADTMQISLASDVSDHRWQARLSQADLKVEPGEEITLPVEITVPADAWADRSVRVSIVARLDNGSQRETFQEIRIDRDAIPSHAQVSWPLPAELLGGFNIAAARFGARWTHKPDPGAIGKGFDQLIDGMAVRDEGLVLRGTPKGERRIFTLDLAGDTPVDVAGFAVNLMGYDALISQLKTLDVSLSVDGQNFEKVLHTTLLPVKSEQAFALDNPQAAKFARIVLEDSLFGRPEAQGVRLGEFKVISTPNVDISNGSGFNLAGPDLGGHVVWSNPQISFSNWDSKMLAEDGKFDIRRVPAGQGLEWVLGFHHDRAAKIERLEWVDAATAVAEKKITLLTVSVSLDSPVGPWIPIGEWNLGENKTFQPDTAQWARFVRFSIAAPDKQTHFTLPDALRVMEVSSSADYRSILTEWGHANQSAYYEHFNGLNTEQLIPVSGNSSRETAHTLPLNKPVTSEVMLDRNEDWYRLEMPAGDNTLVLNLAGDPTVRAVASAETESGEPLVVRKLSQTSTPARHQFEVSAETGSSLYLNIAEPSRNVMFLWDTSASIGTYLPIIYNALGDYAKDLVPGRDAANLLPFGGDVLLQNWYGDPYVLQTIVNDYPRKESSSAAESTLAKATSELAPRAGTKAIVMMTDAATGRDGRVWQEFRDVQPRIFGLGVSSEGAFGSKPAQEQDLMQDWSRVNGGYYSYIASQGELEVAYDRAATMLRRPAQYELSATSLFREAPGPGALSVVSAAASAALVGGAVELILDASGSMLKRLDGERRIDIAKQVLGEAVAELIPAGTPMALRVFGHREPNACRTDLEIPLAPLDVASVSKTLNTIQAKNLAKTPIAKSLAMVASDLKDAPGSKVVILVSDGEETCEGDPQQVIEKMADAGLDIILNIVGFAIDDAALEARFRSWATQGGGEYFQANDRAGLRQSIAAALSVPYEVFNQAGDSVAKGLVDGPNVELPQGIYRVVVRSEPRQVFKKVEIPGEKVTQLDLKPVD